MMAAMAVGTCFVPFGGTNFVTYLLSVAAIVVTGVVLIQGSRDTAAIQAKLDELIVATEGARNQVVGLEKQEPEAIAAELQEIEGKADG